VFPLTDTRASVIQGFKV